MGFGLQFFPDVSPDQKSAQQYWNECLELVDLCDGLGFTQVRTVEHYFEPYGGYSPAPHIFLTAASQRTKKAHLLTGAVLPVFNHPLKIAGEIGMLDAISNGRLDCGFGRAFLAHEFQRFDRSMYQSRARFHDGVDAVLRLLVEGNVTFEGEFHRFKDVTSLPRPTQRPRPPFWTAALDTPESLRTAGERGFNLKLVPFAGPQMREAIGAYREAWQQAVHPGGGKVALGFHMFCHQDREEAHRIARANINAYFKSLVGAAKQDSGWGAGTISNDYPNYDSHLDKLRSADFESLLDIGAVWVGTPDDIKDQIASYHHAVGGFDWASLQVNFHQVSKVDAEASMRLFSKEVMLAFAPRSG